MGSLSSLQGIFPTQGLNLGLPHCRRILYCLSHQDKGFSVNLGMLFIPCQLGLGFEEPVGHMVEMMEWSHGGCSGLKLTTEVGWRLGSGRVTT